MKPFILTLLLSLSVQVATIGQHQGGTPSGNTSPKAGTAAYQVVLNIGNALIEGGKVRIPLTVDFEDNICSASFGIGFNTSKLTFDTIINKASFMAEALGNVAGDAPDVLNFTSYCKTGESYDPETYFAWVVFDISTDEVASTDFNTEDANSYFGVNCPTGGTVVGEVVINDVAAAAKGVETVGQLKVYPNPAGNYIVVEATQVTSVQLFDMAGQLVADLPSNPALALQGFTLSPLARGMYTLRAINTSGVANGTLLLIE